MKLSTKGRYGLRALVDLASYKSKGPVATRVIAERQGISERYLEQLLVSLKQAGLVKSVRGAQGGYILAREPKDIKVGEIIRILEGPIAPVECVSEINPEDCVRSETCITKNIWSKLRDAMVEVLDSYTLEDLLKG
ncbi:Rrf2 family transcriptional regulator [Bacillota bacterium LX-D]|nr:Rrf2 family transcriptional regulator [Bacillota bacterium LX-D]